MLFMWSMTRLGKKWHPVDNVHESDTRLTQRDALVTAHREAIRGICDEVKVRFSSRVLVVVEEEGRRGPLESWIQALRHPGMTRWWNSDGARSATPTGLRIIVDAVAINRKTSWTTVS